MTVVRLNLLLARSAEKLANGTVNVTNAPVNRILGPVPMVLVIWGDIEWSSQPLVRRYLFDVVDADGRPSKNSKGQPLFAQNSLAMDLVSQASDDWPEGAPIPFQVVTVDLPPLDLEPGHHEITLTAADDPDDVWRLPIVRIAT